MLRIVLALFYGVAGWAHLARPAPFLAILPPWVAWREETIAWTGVAEVLGAAGLAQGISPALRRAAALGLALYAVAVFPANLHHFALDAARPRWGLGSRLSWAAACRAAPAGVAGAVGGRRHRLAGAPPVRAA